MTTLTQAHRQWASRPADERFTSLTDLQAFAALSRQTSRSKVVSTREIELISRERFTLNDFNVL
jgi:hypothetical protein